jgi:hypothetical protein
MSGGGVRLWASDGPEPTGQILVTEKDGPTSLMDGSGAFSPRPRLASTARKKDGRRGTISVAPFLWASVPTRFAHDGGGRLMPGLTPLVAATVEERRHRGWHGPGADFPNVWGTIAAERRPGRPLRCCGPVPELGLWKSDARAGTVLVKSMYLCPHDLTAVGGVLYFVGTTPGPRRAGGAMHRRWDLPGGLSAWHPQLFPGQLTDIGGGLLIFTASDGVRA